MAELLNLQNKIIPLRNWNKIRNHGDAITSVIIDKLFNGVPIQVSDSTKHLLATGSILFMANRNSVIWGSGVLSPAAYLPPISGEQIKALRGQNSVKLIESKGILCGPVPLGDPGIFASDVLYTTGFKPARRFKVAVIPHHDSINHRFFSSLKDEKEVAIINILDDSMRPLEQIAEADVVISQSLHGLIYAESLAKPSLWISATADENWCFKFNDWFSTTQNPQKAPASIDESLSELIKKTELRFSSINKKLLSSAFPSDLAIDQAGHYFGYEDARSVTPILAFFQTEGDMPDLKEHFSVEKTAPLTRRLNALLRSIFSRWAEHVYCIAIETNSKCVPTPLQSSVIAGEMDKRSYVDYAVIVQRVGHLHEGHVTELEHGVVVYNGSKAFGDSFVLRPSHERLSDNFIVFGV